MMKTALKVGGIWYVKHTMRKHRTGIGVALGLLGVGVAACQALKISRRATAMRGKVVVITGGSRGLGLEIARQFGLAGAHLVLASRNDDELRKALGVLHREDALANGGTAHTETVDVSREDDCKRLIDSVLKRHGRVDVLVNCAGVLTVGPFEDQSAEAFRNTMDVNFFGQLYAIQAVLPHMLERRRGQIVNIASVGGKIAVPHMLPYVASKFALVGFSEGLHAELRGKGIRVTTVCPGLMLTGSHVQVKFVGDVEKEYEWFKFGATVPGVSTSARSAARAIFNATVDGCAEITITPQAALGARLVGLAPAASTVFASLVNQLVMPKSNGNKQVVSGTEIEAKQKGAWSEHLQRQENQPQG